MPADRGGNEIQTRQLRAAWFIEGSGRHPYCRRRQEGRCETLFKKGQCLEGRKRRMFGPIGWYDRKRQRLLDGPIGAVATLEQNLLACAGDHTGLDQSSISAQYPPRAYAQ